MNQKSPINKIYKLTSMVFLGAMMLLLSSTTIFSQKKEIVDKIIGVVGDEIILYSDIKSQILQAEQQGIKLDDKDNCTILEEILMEKLLLNQAKMDSLEVTPAQVEDQMKRRLNYFIQMFGSEDKMVEFYQKPMAQIERELEDALREQLMVQMMQQKITAEVSVTPSEVRKFLTRFPKTVFLTLIHK
jgi:peptidyl-prolyl cis-trans isomerase SurA